MSARRWLRPTCTTTSNWISVDSSLKEANATLKKLLVCDENLELRPNKVPGSTTVQFSVFDTPGLDDTNGDDIKDIARTFSALTKTKEFHLILIMDSHAVPLLPTQEDA